VGIWIYLLAKPTWLEGKMSGASVIYWPETSLNQFVWEDVKKQLREDHS